ncbi:hypothetical protein C8J57DRAFT_1485377 [Mycena rebaudengoi]|nr:hypothetical protein C8J57DRAFT_1485377 [Mycena rebaudengoi]
MGNSDILCAVCGGPTTGVQVAEKPPKFRLPKCTGDSEDESSEDEDECGYDPRIFNEADVEWTYSSLLLGFNARSTAIEKKPYLEVLRRMYITGPSYYEDYGCFQVEPSNDPNFPDGSPDFQCYYIFDATQTSCFPIHEPCLKLLTRVMCGDENIENIDKDSLYHIMSSLHSDLSSCLHLDYGGPDPDFAQNWQSRSGEEVGRFGNTFVHPNPSLKVLVAHPMSTPSLTAFLWTKLSTDHFTLPPPAVIESRARHNPFTTLPYDVAHTILLLLPSHSVLAVCKASYLVHAFFRASNRPFWRAALHSCMPWFWELHGLMQDDGPLNKQKMDYMGLFLWLDKMSTPAAGLGRAIPRGCKSAPHLGERVLGAAAELIWDKSVNADMPAVSWPKPKERTRTRTATAQWLCDSTHFSRGGVFEAVWNEEGSLVGMALTVAAERRVFGKGQETLNQKVELQGELTALVLHMPDIFLHEKTETSVKGITVHTDSGESHQLGDMNPGYCQRVLSISPNHVLAGIVGHITAEGEITRLGLVQYPLDDAGEESFAPALLHRPLWRAPTASNTSALHNAASPIWSHHPRLRALPSTDRLLDHYRLQQNYHEDIVPTDALIWAADAYELRSVSRISAYQPDGDHHIGALRVEFTPESGIEARVMGEESGRRLMPRMDFNPTWDDSATDGSWVPFEVDGQGGERVLGVDVIHDEDIKAVRLHTNRGREVTWGEAGKIWDSRLLGIMEPADGETLVGLAVGFIYPYYSEQVSIVEPELFAAILNPMQYRVKMSSISALTMAFS